MYTTASVVSSCLVFATTCDDLSTSGDERRNSSRRTLLSRLGICLHGVYREMGV